MTNADHNQGDRLNDYLDALAAKKSASSRDLDSNTTEAVRRFNARDDAPPPPHDLEHQIWEELMNQSAFAGAIPVRPSAVTLPGLNGCAHPRSRQMRDSAPRTFPFPGFARLAAAFLLIIALGAGYLAFDPFGGGSERPSSIPAAVAPASTPEAQVTSFPMAGHTIIGAWLIDYEPENPGHNTNFIVFHEDGTVIEYESFSGASIGTWRATGPSTVEFVAINQHHIPLDFMFEPDYEVVQPVLDGHVVTGWRTLELDETGNAFTAAGHYEPRNADGSVIVRLDFREPESPLVGKRLAPVPTEAPATPTT